MGNIIFIFTLIAVYATFLIMDPVKAPGVIVNPPAPIESFAKKKEPVKEAPKAEAEPAKPAEPVVETNPVDIEKGKTIYLSTCIKCHNKDPNVKGAIGPEIVDAPLEIMMYKVANGKYPKDLPAGFVPKRKTNQMIKQPQHIKDVPSIHAYVQSVKKSN